MTLEDAAAPESPIGMKTILPTMVTASDITRGQPDLQPYLAGAVALGFDPRTCVVFEDAPSVIRAAHAAGATVTRSCPTPTSSSHPGSGLEVGQTTHRGCHPEPSDRTEWSRRTPLLPKILRQVS